MERYYGECQSLSTPKRHRRAPNRHASWIIYTVLGLANIGFLLLVVDGSFRREVSGFIDELTAPEGGVSVEMEAEGGEKYYEYQQFPPGENYYSGGAGDAVDGG